MRADESALPEQFVQLGHNGNLQKDVHWLREWQRDALLYHQIKNSFKHLQTKG